MTAPSARRAFLGTLPCLDAKDAAELAPFVAAARKVRKPRRRTAASRQRSADIRQWWAMNPAGLPAHQAGGRIPAAVTAAYDAREQKA